MWPRIKFYFLVYLFFVVFFLLQKPLFMLYHLTLYQGIEGIEWFKVIWHGLPLDLTTAGYFTVIPGIMCLFSVWINGALIRKLMSIYMLIILALLGILFIADVVLYTYWGFHIDLTPLFYLDKPKEVMASVSTGFVLRSIAAVLVYYVLTYWLFRRFILRNFNPPPVRINRFAWSVVWLVLVGLLFIPIRGGFTVSTMNVGRAFFSANRYLNHAAINSTFNFLAASTAATDFASQYRFMDDGRAKTFFNELKDKPVTDSIPQLIKPGVKPNIVLLVLESFSASVVEPLGGLEGVTPNLNRLASEGVLFTNCYANSFRTDRGLVSILSGYPAQPTASIMKYPEKTQLLPSISQSLKQAGYDLAFYYGGDINFTKMRSYFVGSGIDKIVCDKDFPLSERLSKWGAQDHVLFNRLSDDLKETEQHEPFFKMVLTLSSHEPFEVPSHRFAHPYVNAIAYTDSCVGRFIDDLRASPYWDNTLVILMPDHGFRYPDDVLSFTREHQHIPLVFAGGAVAQHFVAERYMAQSDLAATLLYQLGLPHDDFTFSRNVLNPSNLNYAFYTYPDGFGMLGDSTTVIYDNAALKMIEKQGTNPDSVLQRGEAFLQCLYDDLGKR